MRRLSLSEKVDRSHRTNSVQTMQSTGIRKLFFLTWFEYFLLYCTHVYISVTWFSFSVHNVSFSPTLCILFYFLPLSFREMLELYDYKKGNYVVREVRVRDCTPDLQKWSRMASFWEGVELAWPLGSWQFCIPASVPQVSRLWQTESCGPSRERCLNRSCRAQAWRRWRTS